MKTSIVDCIQGIYVDLKTPIVDCIQGSYVDLKTPILDCIQGSYVDLKTPDIEEYPRSPTVEFPTTPPPPMEESGSNCLRRTFYLNTLWINKKIFVFTYIEYEIAMN